MVHFVLNSDVASSNTSTSTFGKKPALELLEAAQKLNACRLIIVSAAAVTAYALKEFQACSTRDSMIRVEVWPMLTCLSGFHKHQSVPQHRRLRAKERKEFYEKYRIAQGELPRLLVTDVVSRYFSFDIGDVVEVIQATHIGYMPTYKVVVAS